MKISAVVLFGFFLVLLLFSITTFINYQQYDRVNKNSERIERSTTIVRHSNRFQRNFLIMVRGLRGYFTTDEPSLLQTYDSAVAENSKILHELLAFVKDGSDQKIILEDIRQLHDYWKDEFATPLLAAKRLAVQSPDNEERFHALYREKVAKNLQKDVQASLQKKFSEFTNFEYSNRASELASLTSALEKTKSISFHLTVVSIVLGIFISVFIAHYISNRIVRMVDMANQIAEGNYQVHAPVNGKSELSQLGSALNRMAGMLRRNFTQLQRQKEEVDKFAYIVSHDLKAPLRGIDNMVTWIMEDYGQQVPADVNQLIVKIKGRIKRAENLLKGVLMFALAGKDAHAREIVDVNELLFELVNDLSGYNNVHLMIQPNLPVLYTQRVPLEQVFSNLIVNAFKYHDKNEGFVKVYFKDVGDHYNFFVEDNGPGIPEQYHTKIFAMFETLRECDALDSMGVGLAIVKKILDERQLSVAISSTLGTGTIFSFTWPKNEIHEFDACAFN